jgi:hypothetical protein
LNYDAITALTRKKYLPNLVDNVFKSNALLAYLKGITKTYDGGYKIVEPLIYDELLNVTSYSGYDTLTYDQNTPITAAEFDPRNVVAPITISKEEELKNEGENEVLNLLESKVKIAEKTLKKKLTTQLLGDGTGNSGKDLMGLKGLISDVGTIGGIDRATYTWWKCVMKANGGLKRNLSIPLMLSTFLACSDGDEKPDFILTDKKGWQAYHELVRGVVQIQSPTVQKMASLGFQTLEFMGVPLVYDENMTTYMSSDGVPVPVTQFYFLNSEFLKFRPHKNANFATTKWRQADNMLAMRQEILFTAALTINNCRRHGILKDIDVSAY